MKSTFQLFKESLGEFFTNFYSYIVLFSGSLVCAALVAFIEPSVAEDGTFLWTSQSQMFSYTGVFILSLIISILTAIAVTYKLEYKEATVEDAFRMGAKYFMKNLLMSILAVLAIMVGLVLLILPGIWLSISFMFAMFFIVLKGQGVVDSIKSSFNLVKGRWWMTFGKLLLFGILTLLLMIPLFVVSSFLGSITGETMAYVIESTLIALLSAPALIFMYLLFKELEQTQAVGVHVAPVTEPPVVATPTA